MTTATLPASAQRRTKAPDARTDYETPPAFFAALHAEFCFTLDAAACHHNAKCERYFTEADDGLAQPWSGVVFVNPPYGRGIGQWVAKAASEAQRGVTSVLLLPASCETAWWQDHIWDEHRHQPREGVEVRFPRGRINFWLDGKPTSGSTLTSAVVVFRPAESNVQEMHNALAGPSAPAAPTLHYSDDACELWLGDARAGLGQLEAESVACSVFSPPYNVGYRYGELSDQQPFGDYQRMADEVCSALYTAMQYTGRVWVNVAPSVALPGGGSHSGKAGRPRLSLLHVWQTALLAAGFRLHDPVCWATPGRGGGSQWGSWASPAAPNLRGEWEIILCAYKGQWDRRTPDEFRGWQDELGEWQALACNLWRMQPEHRTEHPAPYPVELPARCIRLSTWPGELVVDPFIGSGSTALAAAKLGRRCIGIDAWPAALDMAADRLMGIERPKIRRQLARQAKLV